MMFIFKVTGCFPVITEDSLAASSILPAVLSAVRHFLIQFTSCLYSSSCIEIVSSQEILNGKNL